MDAEKLTELPDPGVIRGIADEVAPLVPAGEITRHQLWAALQLAARKGHAYGYEDALTKSQPA